MSQLALVQNATSTVIAACDTSGLAVDCFDKLGSLFSAIAKAAGPETHIGNLAGIGSYLCDDWGAMHDEQYASLASKLEELKKSA